MMFGTIAASGVRIISRETLNRRAILIIALSLAVGLGISQQPQILQFMPEWLKIYFLLVSRREASLRLGSIYFSRQRKINGSATG